MHVPIVHQWRRTGIGAEPVHERVRTHRGPALWTADAVGYSNGLEGETPYGSGARTQVFESVGICPGSRLFVFRDLRLHDDANIGAEARLWWWVVPSPLPGRIRDGDDHESALANGVEHGRGIRSGELLALPTSPGVRPSPHKVARDQGSRPGHDPSVLSRQQAHGRENTSLGGNHNPSRSRTSTIHRTRALAIWTLVPRLPASVHAK